MTIGERIKERRKELHLSQTDLAKRMGYKSKVAISNVENNKEDLTTTRVRKYAEALQTTTSYLMGWDDEKENSIIKEIKEKNRFARIALEKFPNEKVTKDMVADLIAQKINLTPKTAQFIQYINELSDEDRYNILMYIDTIRNKGIPLLVTDKLEKKLIEAYRNASAEIKGATCAVLGIKGATELGLEKVSNE